MSCTLYNVHDNAVNALCDSVRHVDTRIHAHVQSAAIPCEWMTACTRTLRETEMQAVSGLRNRPAAFSCVVLASSLAVLVLLHAECSEHGENMRNTAVSRFYSKLLPVSICSLRAVQSSETECI